MRDEEVAFDQLSFGIVASRQAGPVVAVRTGARAIRVGALAAEVGSRHAEVLASPSLNRLLAAGRDTWREVGDEVATMLSDRSLAERVERHVVRENEAPALLPIEVADYVDFYSSEYHARNVGSIFRPNADPLPANWLQLPEGYHGRAGTVVVSGTPIRRPFGQRALGDGPPSFGPSLRLDFEAEVGFVVGVGTELGTSVSADRLADHVFGVCLVNDWSARDVQSFEYVPLGPFLGKSFATSMSAWVTPLEALAAARVVAPGQVRSPGPGRAGPPAHLAESGEGGFAIELEVVLNGTVISRPPFASMHWSAGQQLAHLTSNGASLRTGDLFASGTVSGPSRDQWGSMLELSWNASRPVRLDGGAERGFLEDGDEVTIRASVPKSGGRRLELGEVSGKILPARG